MPGGHILLVAGQAKSRRMAEYLNGADTRSGALKGAMAIWDLVRSGLDKVCLQHRVCAGWGKSLDSALLHIRPLLRIRGITPSIEQCCAVARCNCELTGLWATALVPLCVNVRAHTAFASSTPPPPLHTLLG